MNLKTARKRFKSLYRDRRPVFARGAISGDPDAGMDAKALRKHCKDNNITLEEYWGNK